MRFQLRLRAARPGVSSIAAVYTRYSSLIDATNPNTASASTATIPTRMNPTAAPEELREPLVVAAPKAPKNATPSTAFTPTTINPISRMAGMIRRRNPRLRVHSPAMSGRPPWATSYAPRLSMPCTFSWASPIMMSAAMNTTTAPAIAAGVKVRSQAVTPTLNRTNRPAPTRRVIGSAMDRAERLMNVPKRRFRISNVPANTSPRSRGLGFRTGVGASTRPL